MKTLALLALLQSSGTRLGVKDGDFTINDKPTFLLGISYYAGLGASDETLKADLDDAVKHGFNWIRVWATWGAFENDVSAVDAEGNPREPHMSRLKSLVAECDRRGLVVDVTLSKGNGVTGPPRLQDLNSHRRAAFAVAQALADRRNWYIDLANERSIKDRRFASFADLKDIRETLRAKIGPWLLVTASHAGGDLAKEDVRGYLDAGIDFLSPHRPRNAASPGQSAQKTREAAGWMKELGRVIPVHYQEPFRRGYGWSPKAEDFLADLKGAREGGAAGWCFHNGDERLRPDGKPRRSFDLREKRLFDQLDEEEKKFLAGLK